MRTKDLLLFIIGGLTGAAITWFLTSEEGKKFLKDLKEKGGSIKDDLANEWHEYMSDFEDLINEVDNAKEKA